MAIFFFSFRRLFRSIFIGILCFFLKDVIVLFLKFASVIVGPFHIFPDNCRVASSWKLKSNHIRLLKRKKTLENFLSVKITISFKRIVIYSSKLSNCSAEEINRKRFCSQLFSIRMQSSQSSNCFRLFAFQWRLDLFKMCAKNATF